MYISNHFWTHTKSSVQQNIGENLTAIDDLFMFKDSLNKKNFFQMEFIKSDFNEDVREEKIIEFLKKVIVENRAEMINNLKSLYKIVNEDFPDIQTRFIVGTEYSLISNVSTNFRIIFSKGFLQDLFLKTMREKRITVQKIETYIIRIPYEVQVF